MGISHPFPALVVAGLLALLLHLLLAELRRLPDLHAAVEDVVVAVGEVALLEDRLERAVPIGRS